MRPEDIYTLREEACYLYRSLFFGQEASETLISQYCEAVQALHQGQSSLKLQKIVRLNLDIEAIEYYIRSQFLELREKMEVIIHLAELDSKTYSQFHNHHNARLRGFLLLSLSVLRAIWMKIKGWYLVWRYQLV